MFSAQAWMMDDGDVVIQGLKKEGTEFSINDDDRCTINAEMIEANLPDPKFMKCRKVM